MMKKLNQQLVLAALSIALFINCESEDAVRPSASTSLESVGFVGILPNGGTFGSEGVVASNSLGVAASSADGTFLYHLLSIDDTMSGITIRLELPHLKYSDEFGVVNNDEERAEAAKTYDFPKVKNQLIVGEKLLLSSQEQNPAQAFRVLVIDQRNYHGFTSEGTLDQTGSYLTVLEQIEGTETHPTLGAVKSLEVVFGVKVNVAPSDTNPIQQTSALEGVLRMKYVEQE